LAEHNSDQAARDTRRAARAAQEAAQRAARDAIAALREEIPPGAEVPVAPARVEIRTQAPDPASLPADAPARQILATADGMETHIAETYRVVKAVEQAAMRQVPVEDALKKTRIALPDRPAPDLTPLTREARTPADVEDRKQAYRAAQSQLSASVSLAEQLLIQARGEDLAEGVTIDYEGMKVAAARHEAYQEMAQEDAGAQAKDMTALMLGTQGTPATPASAGTRPGGTPYPEPPKGAVLAMPSGRRFTTQAGLAPAGSQWISVNDWYCIGPFPNPGRREVDTRFPPDSVIDLDASYRGMDGKMVSWEFVKSPAMLVSPPDEREYGIYYFHTELWFEEAMDLWVAVGSDDNSRIWVDDKMIWLSAYELKSWRVDEGFRKVHFKQGHNKVLVRLENGWHACEFSFLLHLAAGGS
jgi:hypothetical protein